MQEKFETEKNKGKKEKANKSIDIIFKSMLTNLVRLSNMADQKAGLMISVNSIMISIIVTFLVEKIELNKALAFPTIFLLIICLLTIIFSIIATRPSYKSSDKEDLSKFDPLFFGHINAMSVEEYKIKFKSIISNEEEVLDKIIANIHSQGKVMARKFKYLKVAYTIFMIGLPLAIISFILVLL
jgi:hypothetical protein